MNVKVQRGETAFAMKNPRWKIQDDNAELQNPTVYFVIAISTDEALEEVMEGIGAEWSRSNGKKCIAKILAASKHAPR